MKKVICTLWILGRNANKGTSHSAASTRSIFALAILFVCGLLTHSAAAQTSPQIRTTQAHVTPSISREILAIHARAKRPVAAAPTSLELAAATRPRPNWSRSWVQLIPRATLRRCYCPSLLLWTVSFRGQSEPCRASSITEIRHGGCCAWDHYPAAIPGKACGHQQKCLVYLDRCQ